MKTGYLAIIACALMLGACSSEKKSESDKEEKTSKSEESGYVIEKVSYSDSITVGRNRALSTCNLTYLKPEGTNEALASSVDAWERKMLGMDKETNLTGLALAKAVVTDNLQSSQEDLKMMSEDDSYPPMTYEYYYNIEDTATMPRYITMVFTGSIYAGGAHGMAGVIGQTFVVKNGAKLGFDMFRPGTEDEVLDIVKKGLMDQYFQVSSERDFYSCLNYGMEDFDFPRNPPYFEENGVAFQYQQYEIAPYSSGMPCCVIDYDVLKPYFTESVLKLLDE